MHKRVQLPKEILPGRGALTGAQQRGRRSKLLREIARQAASLEKGDRILVAGNRFPAIPDDLDPSHRAILVMLRKGIDDLRSGEVPTMVEVYDCDVAQLNELRQAVLRHVSGSRDKVALPFDDERCERNSGNVLTREGSISRKVACKLITRSEIDWR